MAVLEFALNYWQSDVGMFEMLPRDWILKSTFIQKWASVDYCKLGVEALRRPSDSNTVRWTPHQCPADKIKLKDSKGRSKLIMNNVHFLADRTNGRAHATVLRLSSVVCRL